MTLKPASNFQHTAILGTTMARFAFAHEKIQTERITGSVDYNVLHLKYSLR